MKKYMLATAAAVLLAACATPYRPLAGNFGYTHTRLAPNVFEVTFRGNAATKPEEATDLALLRSAELTLASGNRYFVIVQGQSAIRTDAMTLPGAATTTTSGTVTGGTLRARSTTVYQPGQTMVFEMPRTSNTIVATKDRPDVSGLVYDAQFLWVELGAKYKVQREPSM